MKFKEFKIKGVYEISLEPHIDHRGFFMRTYDEKIFKKHKIIDRWVQENHSFSKKKGIIRGLHFQHPPYSEAKIVRSVSGEMLLVFVDLRKNSKTFGKWDKITISIENKKMLYVPKGFALGMCTLTDKCSLLYKMGEYYTPEKQGAIKWNDPDIGIQWPIKTPVISQRDKNAISYKEFREKYGGF